MVSALLLGAWALLPLARGVEPPGRDGVPEQEIRLTGKGELKDLFDSGLRPFRFPGLESTSLEVKHLRVKITQPDGSSLPTYSAELIDIGVCGDGKLLGDMEFHQPNMPLAEARSEMMRWMHLASTMLRLEKDLDAFLAAVVESPLYYDDPDKGYSDKFLVRWKDRAGLDYNVWFHKARDPAKPLAIYLKIAFPHPEGNAGRDHHAHSSSARL
ncbi:MAG: hypothetical protein QM755_18040 [Luteolibacter sp.]